MNQLTYPYLTLPKRQDKPRTVGRTMVHDSGLGVGLVEGHLETAAPYIDYYKFRSMTHALYPEEVTLRKIDLVKQHGIKPFMGGNFAELAYVSGTLEEHLDYTTAHGWEATEISETYVTFPEALKSDLIARCAEDGLEHLMVECGTAKQVGWFMREMGAVINIGNVALDQAIEIEPLRRGIGRAVDYSIYQPYLD